MMTHKKQEPKRLRKPNIQKQLHIDLRCLSWMIGSDLEEIHKYVDGKTVTKELTFKPNTPGRLIEILQFYIECIEKSKFAPDAKATIDENFYSESGWDDGRFLLHIVDKRDETDEEMEKRLTASKRRKEREGAQKKEAAKRKKEKDRKLYEKLKKQFEE